MTTPGILDLAWRKDMREEGGIPGVFCEASAMDR